MKATILGRRYDTARAVTVGEALLGSINDSWSQWTATLYASPHGTHWFIAGAGGRMTVFGGRERIIPITLLEAGDFATRYLGRGTPAAEALFERIARREREAEATKRRTA